MILATGQNHRGSCTVSEIRQLKGRKSPVTHASIIDEMRNAKQALQLSAHSASIEIYSGIAWFPCDSTAIMFTAQCTLVQMRGLGIACRQSVRLSVCL